MKNSAIVAGALAVVWATALDARAAGSCEGLASLALPGTTVTLAQTVPAGAFKLPAAGDAADGGGRFDRLPAFCRVAATLKPSSDSDIKIEVWLPVSGWNGKYQAVGNGGWAGSISYPAMARALAQGYATASTDTGHTGGSGAFAFGHLQKLIDFAYRAPHEMTVTAKSVIDAFYGSAPKLSYWNGCSTGGRQALISASRYPNDYDGIIAGAAANPKTHLDAWRVWMMQAVFKDAASVIPASKYPAIHEAVMNACDKLDGVGDGLIEDPTRCKFDPKVLQCQAGDGPLCLTEAQVATARVLMSPVRDRKTGAEIFPGYEPGTELGWARLLAGPDPFSNSHDSFKYVIFNPKWDWRSFDLERDLALANKIGRDTLGPIGTDLSAFAKRGGKLLMYHGWSDNSIAPRASVNYYERTMETTRSTGKAGDWVRLFMAPGMGHCSGGAGPDTFDMVAPIEQWVENGKAPERIVASKSTAGKVTRTRPLCPYPQVARYKGTGSIDAAENFMCAAPSR
jgi:feruloyl esterase